MGPFKIVMFSFCLKGTCVIQVR